MKTELEICPFTGQEAGYRELPNGDEVCKHCGSWKAEQFLVYVDKTINDPDIDFRIELADRRHKLYVTKDGVKNASEGAIKHYLVHLKKYCEDMDISIAEIDIKLHKAFQVSKEKSSVYLEIFEQKLKNKMI